MNWFHGGLSGGIIYIYIYGYEGMSWGISAPVLFRREENGNVVKTIMSRLNSGVKV